MNTGGEAADRRAGVLRLRRPPVTRAALPQALLALTLAGSPQFAGAEEFPSFHKGLWHFQRTAGGQTTERL
jgi:hypothetical protein